MWPFSKKEQDNSKLIKALYESLTNLIERVETLESENKKLALLSSTKSEMVSAVLGHIRTSLSKEIASEVIEELKKSKKVIGVV